MAEDENGDKMHTLLLRGRHIILKEPLLAEEKQALQDYFDSIDANWPNDQQPATKAKGDL